MMSNKKKRLKEAQKYADDVMNDYLDWIAKRKLSTTEKAQYELDVVQPKLDVYDQTNKDYERTE